MRKLSRLSGLLLLTALASGCQTSATIVTDTSCSAFRVITLSRSDSEQTKREVAEHNAAWRALCQ